MEQGKQRIKVLLAAGQAEVLIGQQDPHAGGGVIATVTEGEENIRLAAIPDEEGARLGVCEYAVGLLHGHSLPVIARVLELHICVCDQMELCLAGEWPQVCRPGVQMRASHYHLFPGRIMVPLVKDLVPAH